MAPSRNLTDQDWLTRLREGDERAFAYFYNLYSVPIYRKLLKMVKVQVLAEELLQDVFVRLWDKRHLVDPSQPFKSYLYLIAQNLVYDFYRRLAREERLQAEVRAISSEIYLHTEEALFLKETRDILEKAVDQLPAQQKLVFTLCKLEGKSYEEVGESLGISVSTVNGHIVRATKSVKEYMFNYQHMALAMVLSASVLGAVN